MRRGQSCRTCFERAGCCGGDRTFSHCHLARREPGIQASVSSFSHLPVPCRGCHWPNPAPSRVQLHQTLRQAEESGSGGIVESSAENPHQDLWVSTLEFSLESLELISLHDRPREWGEGCYHGETSRKMGLGC